MDNNFTYPTQYQINSITIEDLDVIGLFVSLDYWENIFTTGSGGSLVLIDTEGAGFIENYGIEFLEKFEYSFTNARGEEFNFKGVLNGLRNETVKQQRKTYVIDYVSDEVRKNESSFVRSSLNNKTPEEVCREMITDKLEGKIDEENWKGGGLPMTFTGNTKRACDIIAYSLKHGVTQESSITDSGVQKEETSRGTTGFLCWQTLDGWRFCSVNDILEGAVGEEHPEFYAQLQNKGASMEKVMDGIISYEFPMIGDLQSRMRAGAFKNVVISFDMDKGLYKEFTYEDDSNITYKQKEATQDKVTRYMNKMLVNERFNWKCEPAQPNTGDQSRQYLAQGAVRYNTFEDQIGNFTLPPQFLMRAGDRFEAKIGKVLGPDSEESGGFDKKHSGTYVIKNIGHHMNIDGNGYTTINTIRSTIRQDDDSSNKMSSTPSSETNSPVKLQVIPFQQ